MSVTSLRPINVGSALPAAGEGAHGFGLALMQAGHLSASQLLGALAQPHIRLADYILAENVMSVADLYSKMAAHWAVGLADFDRHPLDLDLLAKVDAAKALAGAWVPWRRLGQVCVVACAYPEDFAALAQHLRPILGEVVFVLAPRAVIEQRVLAQAGGVLARRAETLLPPADSCRSFAPKTLYGPLLVLGLLLAAGVLLAPNAVILALLGAALILAFVQSLLKLAGVAAQFALPRPPAPDAPPLHIRLVSPAPALPTISIMVPLLRESRIVARLIRRLDRLDYPRDKLEILLLLEDNDPATAHALSGLHLPSTFRVLTVPAGTIRTKPRALNHGLSQCQGDIVGVYDAEDAPDAQQLRAVAAAFAAGDARLACLQGRLDYFNPHINGLSRCFTIEYGAWWRVILPSFARMGFALPLGGTTLFFRRAILQDLGGWDAHNVTEDAELGLRLARLGYKTQLLDSTTYEEANCQTLPWINQRSRWIKGYMITWLTFMRAPAALWRDLGAWRFFGFQVMFAGSVLQALLAPMLWSLWLAPFGLYQGAISALPQPLIWGCIGAMIFVSVLQLGIDLWGLRKTGHRVGMLWAVMMVPYHMMASLAAYKALFEVLTRPFYWHKTAHGLFDHERA
jgi:cellulose synthase/poly-beta-1,6-N-acetylglucosamine synthase-like glycosyltransferase